jgi:hypothetical protein
VLVTRPGDPESASLTLKEVSLPPAGRD